MYHQQDDVVELHDDIQTIEAARLESRDDGATLLHMTFLLRPGREYAPGPNQDMTFHSTNGVNHSTVRVPVQMNDNEGRDAMDSDKLPFHTDVFMRNAVVQPQIVQPAIRKNARMSDGQLETAVEDPDFEPKHQGARPGEETEQDGERDGDQEDTGNENSDSEEFENENEGSDSGPESIASSDMYGQQDMQSSENGSQSSDDGDGEDADDSDTGEGYHADNVDVDAYPHDNQPSPRRGRKAK